MPVLINNFLKKINKRFPLIDQILFGIVRYEHSNFVTNSLCRK